ncbi:hypothetical protein E9840_12210 [Tissierella creatinini]|nr:hypothetical protein E9840_12210 [Tissierella creatinini]TJX63955.1 hypothetical protein E8P77_13515 [Soehngenia saccharolytica]
MKLNENREIWIQRVEDFKSSNLNQTDWSKTNGVSVSTLRYWIRKLDGKLTAKPVNDSSEFEFASVSITEQASPAITIEVKDVRLAITNDYDEMLLLKLVKTLMKL